VLWPRRSRGLKTDEDKRHFLGEVHNKFFRRPHELQSKFIYKFILYLPTNSFSVFFYQFATKTRNLLFAIQLLFYIIYDDKTIIGFVGLVVNLLNRPTDGAAGSVRKRVTFRSLVST
jgi:predicted RNA methylase